MNKMTSIIFKFLFLSIFLLFVDCDDNSTNPKVIKHDIRIKLTIVSYTDIGPLEVDFSEKGVFPVKLDNVMSTFEWIVHDTGNSAYININQINGDYDEYIYLGVLDGNVHRIDIYTDFNLFNDFSWMTFIGIR